MSNILITVLTLFEHDCCTAQLTQLPHNKCRNNSAHEKTALCTRMPVLGPPKIQPPQSYHKIANSHIATHIHAHNHTYSYTHTHTHYHTVSRTHTHTHTQISEDKTEHQLPAVQQEAQEVQTGSSLRAEWAHQ